MNRASWYTFQVLTKRPTRLVELSPRITWTPSIWMGVTVENAAAINRCEKLKECDALIKFISAEPLLESINTIDLAGINWLILCGESGAGCRSLGKQWVIELRDLAQISKVNTLVISPTSRSFAYSSNLGSKVRTRSCIQPTGLGWKNLIAGPVGIASL